MCVDVNNTIIAKLLSLKDQVWSYLIEIDGEMIQRARCGFCLSIYSSKLKRVVLHIVDTCNHSADSGADNVGFNRAHEPNSI